MDVSELFSIPTPRHPTTTRCSRAICFLNSSYFFNASIITFSKKKKKFGKKNVTLDPRHGTLALDLQPSTLDPRQKDRLYRDWLLKIITKFRYHRNKQLFSHRVGHELYFYIR